MSVPRKYMRPLIKHILEYGPPDLNGREFLRISEMPGPQVLPSRISPLNPGKITAHEYSAGEVRNILYAMKSIEHYDWGRDVSKIEIAYSNLLKACTDLERKRKAALVDTYGNSIEFTVEIRGLPDRFFEEDLPPTQKGLEAPDCATCPAKGLEVFFVCKDDRFGHYGQKICRDCMEKRKAEMTAKEVE